MKICKLLNANGTLQEWLLSLLQKLILYDLAIVYFINFNMHNYRCLEECLCILESKQDYRTSDLRVVNVDG